MLKDFLTIAGCSVVGVGFILFSILTPTLGFQKTFKISPQPEAHIIRVIEFEKHWHKYLLSLAACEGDDLRPENCGKPGVGLNYKEWKESREAAKKLFSLEEK